MPLILTASPCKVCGTGKPLPDDARFCPNCGREVRWIQTAHGRRVAGLWMVAAVAGLVVLVAACAAMAVWLTPTHRAVAVRTVPRPPPASHVAVPAPPPVAGLVPQPTPRLIPPPTVAPDPQPSDDPPPVVTVPARAGDTDLAVDPLAAYAGGPPADRLSVHGIRLGLAAADVPAAMLAESAPDHLKDRGGNVYAVAAGVITEIHVRDAAVLDRMPIDGTHALLARFGDPDRPPQDLGASMFDLEYAARGIDVRWDDGVQHLDEVTLYRPRRPR